MITIIAGTNRKNSYTKKVALEYQRFLTALNIDNNLFSLDEHEVYVRDEAFLKVENELLKTAGRFIFILPEYNGSYPGVLKMMIDNTDVPNVWWHKKVLLAGVSSGRAGNLRGMEHLTGSLLHMKMIVHPNRLPLSMISTLMDEDDIFTDAAAISSINNQISEFLGF